MIPCRGSGTRTDPSARSTCSSGLALALRSTLLRTLSIAVAFALAGAGPGVAQESDGWNTTRVLDLVSQARELRQQTAVDTAFTSYAADARGYVYFFLDRPDSDERTLVKTDQIALDVFWRAPRETRQRIIGLRDRKELPTRIRYHLDHLTVVQDDFGDRIRLGDGDEVEAVVHPAALGAESVYDYRLADSLSIRLGGGSVTEIRVYEVQVRPRDFEAPGIIGSVFLQRRTGAIVRMSFTFTPASYVDDNLDYIRISLDNLAWDGKYWLPYRQQAELRRELPQLEFLAGSIIRGRFEIGNYRINPELPPGTFAGPRVTAVPERMREAFPFERPIDAQLEEEGLDEIPELESIRSQAYTVVGRRYLSGLGPSRLFVPNVSSIFRHNRAEGSFAGGGFSVTPTPGSRVRVATGYAFGRKKPQISVDLGPSGRPRGFALRVDWNQPVDLGPVQGSSRTLSTLATLVREEDYRDLYFRSGASIRHRWLSGASSHFDVEAGWSRVRSGNDVLSDEDFVFRPVLPVDPGNELWLSSSASTVAGDLELRAVATVAGSEDELYAELGLDLGYERRFLETGFALGASLAGRWLSSDGPLHRHYLIGGRNTLPGHAYRGFAGDRLMLARAEASQAVLAPWLRLRLFGSVGATDLPNSAELPTPWPTSDTGGLLASVGAGVGIGWDILRLDFGRGLDGGEWQAVFSVNHRFWPWL